MKEEQNIPMNDEQDELTIDYRALLQKCLKHWRWFAASVLACLIIAFIHRPGVQCHRRRADSAKRLKRRPRCRTLRRSFGHAVWTGRRITLFQL